MPPAFWDDASASAPKDKSRQMEAVQKKRGTVEPAICPKDDGAIAPTRKVVDKQSWDYVWRSGLAGGMAGCAV